MELSIQNLSKVYNKKKSALTDFSLTLENGILGLLGPNGAGKTTLMKIIATISKPTQGKIFLDHVDLMEHPDKIRKILGFLPQDFGVYPNLNAYEFLNYIAALKGVGGEGLKKRIEQLLEGVNLIESAKQSIATYSGGMKQRIGIAQALLNDPKVLIFDEPTVGLDPEERVRFRNLISELSNQCIIILSSHIVSDIETIADQIVIMKEGKLLIKGLHADIIKQIDGKIYESIIDEASLLNFKSKHFVINTIRFSDKLKIRYYSEAPEKESEKCQTTLEDAYLYFTKK